MITCKSYVIYTITGGMLKRFVQTRQNPRGGEHLYEIEKKKQFKNKGFEEFVILSINIL